MEDDNIKNNNMIKELQNMEEKPDERLWKNIEKRLPKKSNLGIKIASVSGGLVLIAAIILLVVAPNKKQDKTISKQNNKIDNTIIPNNIIEKNNDLTASTKEKVLEQNTNKQPLYNIPKVDVKNLLCNENLVMDYLQKNNSSLNNNNITVQNNSIQNNTPLVLVQKDTTKQQPKTQIIPQNRKSPIVEDTINRLYLFIPNAFTPTESSNNVFKPAYCELKWYEMTIFARNGKQVFHSNSITNGWDGRMNGSYALQGTYIYVIKFENLNGYKNTQKGSVMLIR